MKSKQIKFLQSYVPSSPNTSVTIDWQPLVIHFDKKPNNEIVSWCNKSLSEKLGAKVNSGINEKLEVINEKIIESYGNINITTEDKEPAVAINVVENPRGGSSKKNHFVVLNFRTNFSNDKYNYAVRSSLDIPFDREKTYFGYKICYNSWFFGGFIAFRSLFKGNDEVFLNRIKEGDYPTHIGFYKSILSDLGSKYTHDEKVVIDFRGDNGVNHSSNSTFKVPTRYSFTVKGESTPFLVFKTDYKVKYEASEHNTTVKGRLTQVEILSFSTEPKLDYQAQLIAIQLVNDLSDLIKDYTIGKDGLEVRDLRENDYKYEGIEKYEEETCVLYREK